MLNDILGVDNTMKVIANLGGISLYIPKPDHDVIRYYHERMGGDPKKTAQLLGVSERTVYRAISSKEMENRQLNAFEDNTAKIEKYAKQTD